MMNVVNSGSRYQIYGEDVKEDKVLKDFAKVLNYLDNSNVRKICGDIALSVIKDGAYYGYIVPSAEQLVLQQLPVGYCRTRYSVRGVPAVEFNMKFFDTFRDINYRMKVLNLFPDEFKKGYVLYKQGKLEAEYERVIGLNSYDKLCRDGYIKECPSLSELLKEKI